MDSNQPRYFFLSLLSRVRGEREGATLARFSCTVLRSPRSSPPLSRSKSLHLSFPLTIHATTYIVLLNHLSSPVQAPISSCSRVARKQTISRTRLVLISPTTLALRQPHPTRHRPPLTPLDSTTLLLHPHPTSTHPNNNSSTRAQSSLHATLFSLSSSTTRLQLRWWTRTTSFHSFSHQRVLRLRSTFRRFSRSRRRSTALRSLCGITSSRTRWW